MEPLVSIIIPVYNHEEYIRDCISSIMKQSYRNMEIFLCDDCSTDRSFEIAKGYEEQLKRLFRTVIMERNTSNQGVCKTSNSMIKKCSGKYIFSLASDDALMENGLRELVYYYEDHLECCFIYSNGVLVNENMHFPFHINNYREVYNTVPRSGTGLFEDIFIDNFIFAPGSLILKATFEKFGYYDETLMFDDWEYWLRITRNQMVGYYNGVTVFYRESDKSLSHFFDLSDYGIKKTYRYVDSMLRMINMYKDYVSDYRKKKCGLRKAEDFCINRAMATRDKSLIRQVLNFGKENHIHMSPRYYIKYLLFKLHLLELFIRITGRG